MRKPVPQASRLQLVVWWVCGSRLLAPDVKHVPAKAGIGGFFSLFALKGQNRLTQGNALGNKTNNFLSPEGAKESNPKKV